MSTSVSSDTKQDNIVRIIAWIIAGVVLVLFYVGAFHAPAGYNPHDIDKQYLYSHTHPLTLRKILGILVFTVGVLWVAGLVSYFADRSKNKKIRYALGETLDPPGTIASPFIPMGIIIVAIALIYL